MNENEDIAFSPEVLTEDGVFDLGSSNGNAVIKNAGQLTIIDSISLAVVDKLGTYPEAKNVKFSPSCDYISFINCCEQVSLKVIHIYKKTCVSFAINSHFSVKTYFWSLDSQLLILIPEFGVYLGVCKLNNDVFILEGPSFDCHGDPIVAFNFCGDYFSLVQGRTIITYCTDIWKLHLKIYSIVNPIGLVYTDCYTVAVWNTAHDFVVYSLTGKQLYVRKSQPGSGVRAARMCQQNRLIALSTYDDKVEIYDVLSWENLYSFEYKQTMVNVENEFSIWAEPTTPLEFSESLYNFRYFDSILRFELKSLKNVCDEFKLKTEKKFLLSFSHENRYLACFTPGFHKTVWINDFCKGEQMAAVKLEESIVKGFHWHPVRHILAIITLDSVIFWTEKKVFTVNCKTYLKSFHWLNTKLTMCSIVTKTIISFVYIRNF